MWDVGSVWANFRDGSPRPRDYLRSNSKNSFFTKPLEFWYIPDSAAGRDIVTFSEFQKIISFVVQIFLVIKTSFRQSQDSNLSGRQDHIIKNLNLLINTIQQFIQESEKKKLKLEILPKNSSHII